MPDTACHSPFIQTGFRSDADAEEATMEVNLSTGVSMTALTVTTRPLICKMSSGKGLPAST